MRNSRQTSLFDDFGGVSTSTGMIKNFDVKPSNEDSPSLRRLKKNFNHRIKAIARLKEEAEKLPGVFAYLNKRFHEIIKPTEDRLMQQKLALIEAVDKTYGKKSLTENERGYICSFMQQELNDLSERGCQYDEKFHKYFQLNKLPESQDALEVLQEMVNDMMGGDVDVRDFMGEDRLSPEEFRQKYEGGFREKKAFEEEQQRQKKKKALNISDADLNLHFMKTYKSLAKKIHPDLEQNENIRKEKEKLMQELAHAKDNHDLFQLISVKLKIDRIENTDVVMDESYLKLYADRLLEQKQALEMDIFIMKNHQGRNSWLYQKFHSQHAQRTEKAMDVYRSDLALEIEDYEELAESMKTVKGMKKYIREMMEIEDDFWI